MEENEVNNDNNNENNNRNNFEENAEAIINEVVEYDHPDQVYYFERRLIILGKLHQGDRVIGVYICGHKL